MEFSSWAQVSLGDLLGAFRKAKADCFFERSVYTAEQFTAYEQELFQNLESLLTRLQNGGVEAVLRETQKQPRVFAKGLELKPREAKGTTVHSFFSDANRAFERLCAS